MENKLQPVKRIRCRHHPDERVYILCSGCKKPLCPKCIALKSEDGKEVYCQPCSLRGTFKQFKEQTVEEIEDKKEKVKQLEKAKRSILKNKRFLLLLTIAIIFAITSIVLTFYSREYHKKIAQKGKTNVEGLMEISKQRCEYNILIIAKALENYKFKNKKYPKSLEELLPDYLAFIPIHPFSKENYIYIPKEDGFSLYCPNPLRHNLEMLIYSSKQKKFIYKEIIPESKPQ